MPQLRNPFGYLIVGVTIGVILGAVIGIAIGEGAGGGSGAPVLVRTVTSTQTVRVASSAPAVSPPAVETTTTATTTTKTSTSATATTPTVAAPPVATVTTPVLIQPPTQTATTPLSANDTPPADPFSPPPDFCTSHVCGAGYLHGKGYVVQCADGVWTKQGGQPTACRDDGGLT